MKRPYRLQMWAIMRDGAAFMALPDLDQAEAHYGLLSLNGYSKHKWTIQKVTVFFPHETASERRRRLDRHVQATVELNAAMARSGYALTGAARSCTCHPDDNPPRPCPRKYAFLECQAAQLREKTAERDAADEEIASLERKIAAARRKAVSKKPL